MEWTHGSYGYPTTIQLTLKNGQKSPLLNGEYEIESRVELKPNQYYTIVQDDNFLRHFKTTDDVSGLEKNRYFNLQPNQYVVGIRIYKKNNMFGYSLCQGWEFKLM